MRCAATLTFAILLSVPAFAQVNSRPTEPPIVSAENDAWYRMGEPAMVSGEFYYPAGPAVFFNGNVMVRVGHYNGVPLYADTTLEPHSVVFVPIGRGLMQPYERPRAGELAGTSGSRMPSFPGRSPRDLTVAAPTATAGQPAAAIGLAAPGAVGTAGRFETPAIGEFTTPVQPVRRGQPFRYDSVSVQFRGEKWVMEGPSMQMPAGLIQIAEYKGFPVYARSGEERDRIYVPLTQGRVAPFTPKR